ncbi:MAG: DUF554 domain-containing protein [Clostridia bacterium]|nr:DUF554 domain-containing protein [Clostridia bacterium]MBR5266295.1 DUF554 domain-containing protein [Clostridia bacterium]
MIGTGTLINIVGIVLGGLCGLFFGKFLKKEHQDALSAAAGVSVLFLGIAGAMEGLLTITDGAVKSGNSMVLIISIMLGTLVGEIIGIENWFTRLGEWLKAKTGNAKDKRFVDGFVTASLTVCIGAMAIMGAIQDGIMGDYSLLTAKAVLDFIIIMVMAASLGKGAVFSAVPVGLWQGAVTLLAQLIKPLMTEMALLYLSFVGSVLIFCVGINLVWGKKINVANMLPSIIFAVIAAFI